MVFGFYIFNVMFIDSFIPPRQKLESKNTLRQTSVSWYNSITDFVSQQDNHIHSIPFL